MRDFLVEILFAEPFLLVYALVLTASLIRYSRYYDTPLRFFPIVLMFNLLTVILGMSILNGKDGSVIFENFNVNLTWLAYNSYTLVFFLYMCHIYLVYLESQKLRKALLIGVCFYVLVSLGNIFIQDFVTQSQLYSYMAGALLMIFFGAAYIVQQNRKKEMKGIHHHNLLWWISLGNLVFFTGYAPLKIHRSFWASDHWAEVVWIRNAQLTLVYFLQFSLLAGFLLMWRMKKPTRSLKQFFQGKHPL